MINLKVDLNSNKIHFEACSDCHYCVERVHQQPQLSNVCIVLFCIGFILFSEMLRAKTVQKWVEIFQTNPNQSEVCRTWR